MKTLLPALLAAACLSASAAESPGDFAFAVAIQTPGGDALYRLAMPATVYESAAFADLRDLRVFNGADEVVPYAFLPVERSAKKPAPVVLPIFPLRVPRDARSEDLDLSFEKSAGKTSVRLSSRSAKTGPQVLLGYLIDASALEAALDGIEVNWGNSVADRLVTARLESGDDLKHWNALAADAPLGALAHAGQRLERKTIEYRPLKAKYLRLMWSDPARAIELKTIAGLSPEQYAQPPRAWKEIVAVRDAGKSGEYLADLGGRFPLDRLALHLPQENTIVPIQFLSRGKVEDKWMLVTRSVVYRLRQNGRELVSPEISIGTNSHRYWLLRVEPAAGGIGQGSLIVKAGWTPREIAFAARGPAPFRLAYGNEKAQPGSLGIETLVPGWRTDRQTQISVATTGPVQELAGAAAVRERFDMRKWGLWTALIAGVAVLAWMVWRLTKQMQRTDAK